MKEAFSYMVIYIGIGSATLLLFLGGSFFMANLWRRSSKAATIRKSTIRCAGLGVVVAILTCLIMDCWICMWFPIVGTLLGVCLGIFVACKVPKVYEEILDSRKG